MKILTTTKRFTNWRNSKKAADYFLHFGVSFVSLIIDWIVVFLIGQIIYDTEFDSAPSYAHLKIASYSIGYEYVFIFLSFIWILSLATANCYGTSHSNIFRFNPLKMLRPTFTYFFVLGFLSFLLKAEFSRSIFLEWMVFGTVSLILTRFIIRETVTRKIISQRKITAKLLVVGKTKMEIEKYSDWIFQNKKFGFKVASRLVCSELNYDWVQKFDSMLNETQASHALLLPGMEREKHFAKFIHYLQDLGMHIHWIPLDSGNFGYWELPIPQDSLPFLTFQNPKLTLLQNFIKRIFDITFSVLAIFVLIPIFFALATIILIQDGWPILFIQNRVGKDGKSFRFFKFRTMVVDAENLNLSTENSLKGKHILLKNIDDPRVTRFGKILRRYSLDELPQFFNVLNNSMSVVGPRPALPREVNQYDSLYERRLIAKPGLTGPWQVGGRSDLDLQTSIALDLNYLSNWSFSGDLLLIFKTVQTIFNGRGAY